ncbi:MAG: tetratricopeptide repeat protein [Deltaproteobacteria bacterium]|nr:tetratricopeptide repeat protein [Deltaproteobacteria bacterium]
MENQFVQIITEAKRNNWCLQQWCTTCYCEQFRSAVASIKNIQDELESLELRSFEDSIIWVNAIRIISIDYRSSIDWGRILSRWLPYARQNVRFADIVFYYLVNKVPCSKQIHDQWLTTCLDLALQTKHTSLLESLVRILGSRSEDYEELIPTAIEASAQSELLKSALVKTGFLPSPDDIHKEQKRKFSGQKLFNAIRRKDMKAVCALLAKQADVEIKNQDGHTPLEYAKTLNNKEITVLLEEKSLLQELTNCSRERRLILFDLVDYYIKNRRGSSALIYLEELLEKIANPEAKAILYMQRGIKMEEVEDFEAAILCYSKVFLINSISEINQYFMNNNVGYCLNMLGRYQEAESYCRSAIKIVPFLHNAHKNLGLSLQGQGHYEEASECYIKAIQLNPGDRRALHHLEDLTAAHKESFSNGKEIEEQLFYCRSLVYATVISETKH